MMLFFHKALSFIVGYGLKAGAQITGAGIKATVGTGKDLADIRKTLLETKLAQYKVDDHDNLVKLANDADIKQFDLRYRMIDLKVQADLADEIRKYLPIILFLCLFIRGEVLCTPVPPVVQITCVCTLLLMFLLLVQLRHSWQLPSRY